MNLPLPRIRHQFDRFGVVLSALCAVHCIVGLVIVAGLGLGGSILLHPAVHSAGLLLATVIAAIAIGLGVLRHRRPVPFMVAGLGLGFMGSALIMEHGPQEAVLTVIGVTLVAAGHLFNLRHA